MKSILANITSFMSGEYTKKYEFKKRTGTKKWPLKCDLGN